MIETRSVALRDGDAQLCGVCFEILRDEAILPCCHREDSSLRICRSCVEIVCEREVEKQRERASSLAGIPLPATATTRDVDVAPGRCPRCRAHITVSRGAVTVVENYGACRACARPRVIEDADEGLCGTCALGRRLPLVYVCGSCRGRQRIAHPMWTYQERPGSYTDATWACRRCRRQTRWRVSAHQLQRVPPEHAPASWGRDRMAWLRSARRRARTEESERWRRAPLREKVVNVIMCGVVVASLASVLLSSSRALETHGRRPYVAATWLLAISFTGSLFIVASILILSALHHRDGDNDNDNDDHNQQDDNERHDHEHED